MCTSSAFYIYSRICSQRRYICLLLNIQHHEWHYCVYTIFYITYSSIMHPLLLLCACYIYVSCRMHSLSLCYLFVCSCFIYFSRCLYEYYEQENAKFIFLEYFFLREFTRNENLQKKIITSIF